MMSPLDLVLGLTSLLLPQIWGMDNHMGSNKSNEDKAMYLVNAGVDMG